MSFDEYLDYLNKERISDSILVSIVNERMMKSRKPASFNIGRWKIKFENYSGYITRPDGSEISLTSTIELDRWMRYNLKHEHAKEVNDYIIKASERSSVRTYSFEPRTPLFRVLGIEVY